MNETLFCDLKAAAVSGRCRRCCLLGGRWRHQKASIGDVRCSSWASSAAAMCTLSAARQARDRYAVSELNNNKAVAATRDHEVSHKLLYYYVIVLFYTRMSHFVALLNYSVCRFLWAIRPQCEWSVVGGGLHGHTWASPSFVRVHY